MAGRGRGYRRCEDAAWRKLLLAGAIIAGLALVLPAVASANCVTTNDPTRSADSLPYGAEWVHTDSSGYFDFADAYIEVRNPALAPSCTSTYHQCGSYAWVMMTSQTVNAWAQYGPFAGDYYGSTIGPGADYDQCAVMSGGTVTNFYDNYATSSTVGTSPHYRVHYGTDPDGQSNNKIFVKDGTIEDWCGGTQNNPFTFTPNEAIAGTEIHDAQTQLPGSEATHEQYSYSTVTDPSSGTTDFFGSGGWQYQLGSNFSWLGKQLDANHQKMEEWDGDCP